MKRDLVDYVILFVADLEASVAFYRDVVGLELKFSEFGYAEFVTRHCKLGLYERTRLPDLIGVDATGGGPFGELVFLVEDADGETARLKGLGVQVLAGPLDRPWGHRTVHFQDPDGNVVEFAQEIPRQRPRAGE